MLSVYSSSSNENLVDMASEDESGITFMQYNKQIEKKRIKNWKILIDRKKHPHTNGTSREKTPDGLNRDDSKQKSNATEQSIPKSPVPESTHDDSNHQTKASESIFTPVPAPRKPKGIY